ncbi:nuclease-related domain-containing protein [Nocardioides taihuensis]|uniref:Nuclease-related domain-containing protein n=1 Tax=Nocardioides taihuensis TaxID=1835606 RepID=A0ABW0BFT2_9ACTN
MLFAMSSWGKAPGDSAQEKYDELLRSWRRRNRKPFVVVALVCGAILVASFGAARIWPPLAWCFGVFGGAALAFWLLARLTPPGWIENWQSGAWGEQATARALRELENEGWIVLHDLPMGRGNVDHIVIVPAGVYLLDSKRLGGVVSVDDQGVTVRRLDDPALTYRQAGDAHLLRLARQTHQQILSASRIRTWVTPVMVIWADFPQDVAEGRCTYVHGDQLVSWLRSRPAAIAPTRVRQVADAVRMAWDPTTQRAAQPEA